MDKILVLEEKITKVIDRIRTVTDDNEKLKAQISGLKEEIQHKDNEIGTLKRELKSVNSLKTDIERFNSERETVRSQVENLIKELDSVEM